MPLKPGDKLGSFEILSRIGAGGQGEVYKARDTRLDRFVAIKVLPTHLSARPEMRERFEREARTVSQLNHPNICTLYDIGKQDGTDFLVMEYLDGQTLADRLTKGPLALADALRYAIEIADALDKAHRQGVVHRDLKPGNIMITKSGTKLLDFGLAKQSPAGSTANTINSAMPTAVAAPLTAEGTILGTLQYMSPEQLEGHEADARSDIFAFGATLYELVTGRRAFAGKSQVSLMASIINQDPPPISSLQPVSPRSLDNLVTLCLAKNPDNRWHAMTDVSLNLKLLAERGAGSESATTRAPSRTTLRGWMAAAVTFVLISSALGIAVAMLATRKPSYPERIKFDVETPSARLPNQIALSPDGKRLAAFIADKGGFVLWVRALENLDGQAISGTEVAPRYGGASGFPFWSPDGRFMAFFSAEKLKKVDISGGPPQILCDATRGYGGTWNSNGVIVFAPDINGALFQVSASGGVPRQLTELDKTRAETSHRFPVFLPDGAHFLFQALSEKPENSGIYLGSLDSKERKRMITSTQGAMFAPPDHILFKRDNTLMAQSFDPKGLQLHGDPFPVANGVGGFTVSTNGLLAYRSDGVAADSQFLWFDRAGKQMGYVGGPGHYTNPILSADLQSLVFSKLEGTAFDIWTRDLTSGAEAKFTFGPGNSQSPILSPDGSRMVFNSTRNGSIYNLYQKNYRGVGGEEILFKSDDSKYPLDWSLDGRFILYQDADPKTGFDLWVLPIGSDGKPGNPEPVFHTQFNEEQGQFSPDGKWIVYVSDESGSKQVYVQSFPISGTKYQISTSGGAQPRWRRDGKELFFLSPKAELMAVEINASKDGMFHAGVPQKLFQTTAGLDTTRNGYDISKDGQRFLIVSREVSGSSPITVIVNWMQGQAVKAQ